MDNAERAELKKSDKDLATIYKVLYVSVIVIAFDSRKCRPESVLPAGSGCTRLVVLSLLFLGIFVAY